MNETIYLLHPINKLVSKIKIVLSENSDFSNKSIKFINVGRPFNKASIIEDIGFFENQTNLHFIPFYFFTKEDNDIIMIKRILISIFPGDCNIFYCHAVEANIHLKELEKSKIEEKTTYIVAGL